jgi:hypothetical protein
MHKISFTSVCGLCILPLVTVMLQANKTRTQS